MLYLLSLGLFVQTEVLQTAVDLYSELLPACLLRI